MILGTQEQFEDHGESGLSAETALGLVGSQPHRGDGVLDRVCVGQVPPVFGRESVEGQQAVTVLGQAGDGPVKFGAVGLGEEVEGGRSHGPRSLIHGMSSFLVG